MGTLVIAVDGVYGLVTLEDFLLHEILAALITGVGFFASMNANVTVQGALAREELLTVVATILPIRSFGGVVAAGVVALQASDYLQRR